MDTTTPLILLSLLSCCGVLCENEITDQCFRCICSCKMKCDTSFGCNEFVCGPFGISYLYWMDARKPVLKEERVQDKRAFARCVNDFNCAAKTVKEFMKYNKRDCNRDNVTNCIDFFILHMYGLQSCIDNQHTYAQSQEEIAFYNCLKETNLDHYK